MRFNVEEFDGNLEEFIELFQESMGLSDEVAVRKLISVEVARGTQYAVVRVESKVIGMIGLYIDSVVAVRELEPAQIIDFAVESSYRGQGVGRILMNWAISKAKGLGVDALWLYTGDGSDIKNVYESLGFVEAGRNPGFWQGKWDRVWFKHSLTS